jgi:UDP-2,4-diacetamido-2,4,6-trideoxy-beta-L-altropyranose hydrolase
VSENKNKGTLLIRADANVTIGTGHVMRCLALAQAWQDADGRCVFAMAMSTPAVERRLQEEGIEIEHMDVIPGTAEDARQTGHLADKRNPAWIVADGYDFGADYQWIIKQSPYKLLFVDDNGHAERYCADLVLNQNSHADENLYARREFHTQLLLGPRYAMLRREFLVWRDWKREIRKTGNRILLAMGGSDAGNFTSRVIQALENVKESRLELVAVVGGSNPHLAEVDNVSARSRHSVRLIRDAADMPGLMAWADMAISAAGSICWEFCALALPALLIPVAHNQEAAAKSLHDMGAARLFSGAEQYRSKQFRPEELARAVWDLIVSQSARHSLCHRSRTLVDARGGGRVVAALSGEGVGTEEEA